MATDRTLGVTAVEVVGPEFVVRHAVVHDEIRDFENLMPDRHHRLFVSAMPFDAVISRLQGRAVLPRGAQGGLDQRPPQIAVPLARLPAAPLARALVLAGTTSRPGCSM